MWHDLDTVEREEIPNQPGFRVDFLVGGGNGAIYHAAEVRLWSRTWLDVPLDVETPLRPEQTDGCMDELHSALMCFRVSGHLRICSLHLHPFLIPSSLLLFSIANM